MKKFKVIQYIIIFLCVTKLHVRANQNWISSIDQMIKNGHYKQAIIQLNQLPKKYYSRSKDKLTFHILKANVVKALGYHQQALNVLLPHLNTIKEYPPDIKVRYYNSLGSLYSYIPHMTKASQLFQKALTIARQSGHRLLYCETLNEVGLLYYTHLEKTEYYQLSLDAFNQAIVLANQLPESFFNAQLLINLASVYVKKNAPNHTKERMQSLKNAKQFVLRLSDSFQKGSLLLKIARLYEMVSENQMDQRTFCIQEAHQLYLEAENTNQKLNDHRLASRIFFQMGGLYESTSQFKEAFTLTYQSLFYSQQTKDPLISYQNNWQLGRLYRKTGRIQKAINHYNKAIEQLVPIRKKLYQNDLTKKTAFDDTIKPVYLELSEIYFNLATDESSSLSSEKYVKLMKNAWHTMDDLKSAELENIFDDPCLSHHKENHLQLDRKLESVAVIYFISFPDQPGMIIRFPNGFKHLRLDIDTKVFNEMIYRLRKEIPDWGLFETDATKLYELIIAPIYNDLKKQKIETLVVASDGAIRLLPFSILFNYKEKFLIEEFSIATIPALYLTRLGAINRKSPKGLFCGITKAHTIGGLNFDALPRIEEELKTITQIVPGDVFMDEEFTVSNLESKINKKNYSLVHLATHGEFGSIPEKTFLLTHNSQLRMDTLEKLIKKTKSSAIDLLVLSACQTAIGDERAAFGLAGGAVKAGAKCAIATLWSVDDYASQKIISEFYQNVYHKKLSKAKAMQQAQLTLIEKIQYWHPAIWSAFLVIGNWY